MNIFTKTKKEENYFIYFAFSRLEAGDYELETLGLINLTLEEAKIKLEEIRMKIKNRSVETILTSKGLPRLFNWALLDDVYIEKI